MKSPIDLKIDSFLAQKRKLESLDSQLCSLQHHALQSKNLGLYRLSEQLKKENQALGSEYRKIIRDNITTIKKKTVEEQIEHQVWRIKNACQGLF